jgi:hypothetical protein
VSALIELLAYLLGLAALGTSYLFQHTVSEALYDEGRTYFQQFRFPRVASGNLAQEGSIDASTTAHRERHAGAALARSCQRSSETRVRAPAALTKLRPEIGFHGESAGWQDPQMSAKEYRLAAILAQA